MLLIPPMTLLLPHPRETGCYTWHGTKSVTLTWDAPRCLGTLAPGSLSADRTLNSCQSLPVLEVVESFPGAQSPLRIAPSTVVSLCRFSKSSSRSVRHRPL